MTDIKERLGDYHHALSSDDRQIALERIEELEAEVERLDSVASELHEQVFGEAKAVAAEKERCARIADDASIDGCIWEAVEIAAAIRGDAGEA